VQTRYADEVCWQQEGLFKHADSLSVPPGHHTSSTIPVSGTSFSPGNCVFKLAPPLETLGEEHPSAPSLM
jgi:hypothetical protein